MPIFPRLAIGPLARPDTVNLALIDAADVLRINAAIAEQSTMLEVPSEPSDAALTNIIDNRTPKAPLPRLLAAPAASGPIMLSDVRLQWDKTVHNGRYDLYKMTPSGQWTHLHSVQGNDEIFEIALADTQLAQDYLIKADEDGRPVFHHFKVVATNASGIRSLDERVLTA